MPSTTSTTMTMSLASKTALQSAKGLLAALTSPTRGPQTRDATSSSPGTAGGSFLEAPRARSNVVMLRRAGQPEMRVIYRHKYDIGRLIET